MMMMMMMMMNALSKDRESNPSRSEDSIFFKYFVFVRSYALLKYHEFYSNRIKEKNYRAIEKSLEVQ